MIPTPESGMAYSVNKHNARLDAVCDWVEGIVLFGSEGKVSQAEIVDRLVEEEIYKDQDFAWEFILDVWAELRRRRRWVGTDQPLCVTGKSITRTCKWEDSPADAFCMMLTFAKWYPGWASQFGHDYTTQGALFEELTQASLEVQFSGWEIRKTGWSRSNISNLESVVKEVAAKLGEGIGQLQPWTDTKAKEAGLDLLCYRPFPDKRVGIPVYLMQCASGAADFEDKLRMPDLKIWQKLIVFTAYPKKAFATPLALIDDDFKRFCNIVDGMLMDRCRILAAGRHKRDWVPQTLSNRITSWMKPRVESLVNSGLS
jgi:hypothetical protein